jgi:hypothetical protein
VYADTSSCTLDYEDWMSFRLEFTTTQNLCGCTGISFDALLTGLSIFTGLRVTLSDVACAADINRCGTDEMWWSYPSHLYPIPESWNNFRLPFSGFKESSGAGTRQNDDQLGLQCITAIEFNLTYIWTPNCPPDKICPALSVPGHIEIRNLTTY